MRSGVNEAVIIAPCSISARSFRQTAQGRVDAHELHSAQIRCLLRERHEEREPPRPTTSASRQYTAALEDERQGAGPHGKSPVCGNEKRSGSAAKGAGDEGIAVIACSVSRAPNGSLSRRQTRERKWPSASAATQKDRSGRRSASSFSRDMTASGLASAAARHLSHIKARQSAFLLTASETHDVLNVSNLFTTASDSISFILRYDTEV